MSKPKVTIYTDGACANNPGKGGYGVVLMYEKQNGEIVQKNIAKGFQMTTNNRMELLAVIDALETLKTGCSIQLYSDSKYVIDAINQKWLDSWQEKNWKLNTKNPVKNIDLWKKLINAMKPHDINFIWVKGHASNEFNNLCDKLAVEARMKDNLLIDEGFSL
ncbi:ribonuclease HI [bacterium]|nr:ribonuclease HI [bacterium]